MKKTLLVLILLVAVQVGYTQTWSEWFKQRKTQIKYLLKQIAAYKIYADYLQKGYRIAKDGTELISDIKHGDFHLHNGYFTSLKSVSPAIKNYSKVKEIVSDHFAITTTFRKLIQYSGQSGDLTDIEKEYVRSVYANMNKESEKDLDELILLLTSGQLELKEDERLKRIDLLYVSAKDKLSFTRSFSGQARLLVRQRQNEQLETKVLQKIYGLK